MKLIFILGLLVLRCQAGALNDTLGVEGGDAYDGLSEITSTDVYNAMAFGQSIMNYENQHDQSLYSMGVYLKNTSAGFQRFSSPKLSQTQINNHYTSNIIAKGLEILAEGHCGRYSLTTKEFIKLLQAKQFKITGICTDTSQPVESVATNETVLMYRTIDGSYNNLNYSYWGQAGQVYPRFLDPDYGNSISTPRRAKSGTELTSARTVSVRAFPNMPKRDQELSMAASELTQMISHDMTLQTMDNDLDTGPISCCSESETCILPQPLLHKSCIPVEVDEDDPFFSNYQIGCLNFVRSISAPKSDCTISWREQVNTVTGYLDASIVYGSSQSVANKLRTWTNGSLIENSLGNHHMPFGSGCSQSKVCYSAGDVRVNQQVHLASTQTIYMREHNRIATSLAQLNPQWDDERLYQESRRIMIAEHQHIVYRDLLRLLLGEDFQNILFGSADSNGFTDVYDDTVNGATHNDFTIAYRGLHAIIPETIKLCNEARKVLAQYKFSDMINNVTLMETRPDNIDNVLRGMAFSHMNMVTRHITSEITNKVFKGRNPYGSDLMMMDIQRARDHGVPGYNDYRQLSGLDRVNYFDELHNEMSYQKIAVLKSLYEHPDDIELLVGGLFEEHDCNSKFGPVIKYVLSMQFYRTMIGDRFFYTNKNQTYPFTADQLGQIFNVSLSGMICRNSPNIYAMPNNAFLVESESNPRVSCDSFPDIDFSFWKE